MRYLSLQEVITLHSLLIAQSGGSSGLGDRGALESAVAQPEASFGGQELYPDLASKAAPLSHSLIKNHPSVDGNKPIGHGAMEVFLLLNGYEIDASVDEQESEEYQISDFGRLVETPDGIIAVGYMDVASGQ